MDNNEDMKVPYEVRPEGTGGTLNELAMLHRQSVNYYNTAAESLKGDFPGASDFFASLAKYRNELMTALNEQLEDITAGVHTPSRSGETSLKGKEEQFSRALQSKNVTQLTELAHENEQATSDAYRHALANTKVLDFAEQLLHEQHETVLTWVHRADRYKTVPQTKDEDLK